MNEKLKKTEALLQMLGLPMLASLLGAKFFFCSPDLDGSISGFVEGVHLNEDEEHPRMEIVSSALKSSRVGEEFHLFVSKDGGYIFGWKPSRPTDNQSRRLGGDFMIL